MAVSPGRAAAFRILLKVQREGSYASELLHSPRCGKLSSADHGLATELVMGALRWQSLLDLWIAQASSQKLDRLDTEVLTALRLGLYQIRFLSRIPVRAAIFESVELVKAARKTSAAAYVNGVLRKLAASRNADGESREHSRSKDLFSAIHNANGPKLLENAAHPEWLVRRWIERYGLETTRQICAYNQKAPATTIRVYDRRSLDELAALGIETAPGRLLSAARTVVAGDVTQTEAYRQGDISIQDEASQLVGLLVGPGKTILDCCAAPGGKTTLLARRNPAAMVIASELHPHRARILHRLARPPNIRVIAADACHLPLSIALDSILADVPCSGTGTLAHNPEIKWRLTTQDLHDLQMRQIDILRSALAQLSKGGRLVYSTCSLEPEENEAVVEAALANTSEFFIADCQERLVQLQQVGELRLDRADSLVDGPFLRTIPGVHSCDGFFAAIIERKIK